MDILKFTAKFFPGKKADPFTGMAGGDFYDLQDEELQAYSPRELAALCDTRDLELSPARIADGVAFFKDGRFATALLVNTNNFSMSGENEVAQITGGFHAVLQRLSSGQIQFKVRMVEASLEALSQQIDYALSGNTSAALHRLALGQKQFYRELSEAEELVQRRNYAILSTTSHRLVRMEETFRSETGHASPFFTGLGLKSEDSAGVPQKEKKSKPAGNLQEQRLARRALEQREQEMEQTMYEEWKRTLQSLRRDADVLVAGLSALGLGVTLLPDWELTALFAEYLRPELAVQIKQPETTFSGPAPAPFSLTNFVGAQSNLVVSSEITGLPGFEAGQQRVQATLNRDIPRHVSSPEAAGQVNREAGERKAEPGDKSLIRSRPTRASSPENSTPEEAKVRLPATRN